MPIFHWRRAIAIKLSAKEMLSRVALEIREVATLQAHDHYDRYLKNPGKKLTLGESIFMELPREEAVRQEDFVEKNKE